MPLVIPINLRILIRRKILPQPKFFSRQGSPLRSFPESRLLYCMHLKVIKIAAAAAQRSTCTLSSLERAIKNVYVATESRKKRRLKALFIGRARATESGIDLTLACPRGAASRTQSSYDGTLGGLVEVVVAASLHTSKCWLRVTVIEMLLIDAGDGIFIYYFDIKGCVQASFLTLNIIVH